MRRYDLKYGTNPAVIGVSKATGRSQLTQVTECAADKCFAPTLLSWLDTPTTGPNFSASTAIAWPAMPVPYTAPGEKQFVDDVRPVGDIDGDGTAELRRTMSAADGTLKSYLVSFSANRSPRGFVALSGGIGDGLADFNNDGRVDPWSVSLGVNSGTLNIKFWTATAFNAAWDESAFTPYSITGLCSLTQIGPGTGLLGYEARDRRF